MPADLKTFIAGFTPRGRLLQQVDKRSRTAPEHHAIFDLFPAHPIDVPPGHITDFVGNLWPENFGMGASQPGLQTPPRPQHTEEYFEWIDVLQSARAARRSYTVLEWGGGFGRWAAIGVLAARRMGIQDIHVGICEAEPVHARWAREYMERIGITGDRLRLDEVAVAGAKGTMQFLIGMPTGNDSPEEWYGQALSPFDSSVFRPTGNEYYGRPELATDNGWRAIDVEVVPASQLLEPYRFVDLLDMDVQGAEADAVQESLPLLTEKVRRLHIGTHSKEIEARLRDLLGGAGWMCLHDYSMHQVNTTPFGDISFVDGVQSWANPKLL